eukprot:g20538.t1
MQILVQDSTITLRTYWFVLQRIFIFNGFLEISDKSQNSRFGSAIAGVRDLNHDSFNDVVVGAPLEDDHRGAIYVFHGYNKNILKEYKQ